MHAHFLSWSQVWLALSLCGGTHRDDTTSNTVLGAWCSLLISISTCLLIGAWYNCYCKTLCKWVVWMVHTWPNNINLYYKPTFTCCHSCLPYCTVLGIVTQDYNLLLLHDTCWGKPCSRWMDGPVSPVKPQVRSVESQRFTKVHYVCVCVCVCVLSFLRHHNIQCRNLSFD